MTQLEWRGNPPPPSGISRTATVAIGSALLVAVLVFAVYSLDPAALGLGPKAPQSVPRVQDLTTAGESWNIRAGTPVVVNFLAGVAGSLWMNFTVAVGAVNIWICPASVTPAQMGSTTCDAGGEGATSSHGSALEWWDRPAPEPMEIGFFNDYMAQSGMAQVTLTWTSPLEVLSGG